MTSDVSMTADGLCAALSGGLPALFECAVTKRGAVRVRTPFMYPDGGIVDVFVEDRGEGCLLSDYGEALGWLRMQSFSDRLTAHQRGVVQDVCLTLGVDFTGGELTLSCDDVSAAGDAVHRLGQAVVRVSDIWFTLRTHTATTIGDEVEEWLRTRSFDFGRNVRHTGRSGREWAVDYQVEADAATSLVLLLTTGARSWARRLSERVVAECTDLNHLTGNGKRFSFVSLFNDTVDVWREEDFALVSTVSNVAVWSQPDDFECTLRTAADGRQRSAVVQQLQTRLAV